MNRKNVEVLLYYNTVFFLIFAFIFIFFPEIDIYLSNLFFLDSVFISEKFLLIKKLRTFMKDTMVIIPVLALLYLVFNYFNQKQKIKNRIRTLRIKLVCIGLIVGPIIGSGLIANLIFKDNWGRARPIQIEEFGGNKIFTPAFMKTDQCAKNCSWISGETSAAFSFLTGVLILKNPMFFLMNIVMGVLVFFCRMSMGGHFFSDNVFAVIFMIYLAIIYRYLVINFVKKRKK
tara:strand:+ start:168 stop:860 length:693 start_codon:yes stop_codon:yes gene_type:complete